MTRQRVISIIFANVAGFFVVVWLMVAWIWTTDDGSWDEPVGSAQPPEAPAPRPAPDKPSIAKPLSAIPAARAKTGPVLHKQSSDELPSVSRRAVSDLLKAHAASVSICAQKAHLRGEVRSVDVSVSITPATGGGSSISSIEARRARDHRWDTFSGCLGKALSLARFADASAQSFPVTVRIP